MPPGRWPWSPGSGWQVVPGTEEAWLAAIDDPTMPGAVQTTALLWLASTLGPRAALPRSAPRQTCLGKQPLPAASGLPGGTTSVPRAQCALSPALPFGPRVSPPPDDCIQCSCKPWQLARSDQLVLMMCRHTFNDAANLSNSTWVRAPRVTIPSTLLGTCLARSF